MITDSYTEEYDKRTRQTMVDCIVRYANMNSYSLLFGTGCNNECSVKLSYAGRVRHHFPTIDKAYSFVRKFA